MWNPDPRLHYRGIYPSYELLKARQVLIGALGNTNSRVLERMKPKIGIPSSYGPAVPLLPPVDPPTLSLGSTPEATSKSSDEEAPVKKRRLTQTTISTTATSSEKSSHAKESPSSPTKYSKNSQASEQDLVDLTKDDIDDESNTQSVPIASGAFSIGNTVDEISKETLTERYKCDFCQFTATVTSISEMRKHLDKERHFSASIFKTRQTKETNVEFVYVVKKLALKNKSAKNEVTVVVCPACNDVFEDIFMCGLHYKNAHGGYEGLYSICPVIFDDTAMIPSAPRCDACNMMYESHKKLNGHWRSSDHHPVKRPLPESAFALYGCTLCRVTCHNNFLSCKSHIINHDFKRKSGKSECAMKVKYIEKPTKSEKLPPSVEDVEGGNSLQDNLNTLRNMKRHFKQMGGSRLKRQHISNDIEQLKLMKISPLYH